MTGFRANHGDIEAKGFAAILLSRCHDNRIVCGVREKEREKPWCKFHTETEGGRLEFGQVRLDGIHPSDWPGPRMRMEKEAARH
jgi:hypothetical protein